MQPSWFEIMTAAAFRWFADIAVDVMVLEVGLLGRWDATNVADAQVAVVTNVGIDHTEYAGPTRAHIAAEKAGIVKPGATLVLGETDPDLAAIFRKEHPAVTWERDIDFAVLENQLALGGRLLDLRTPYGTYDEVFLSLHGRHQGDNAVVALTAVESFFDAALDQEVVREAFIDVTVPGRFEVLGHQPLVIIDGAHNPAGADVCASVMAEDFAPVGDEILVTGFLRGRDPADMLTALRADDAALVVCCTRAVASGHSRHRSRRRGAGDRLRRRARGRRGGASMRPGAATGRHRRRRAGDRLAVRRRRRPHPPAQRPQLTACWSSARAGAGRGSSSSCGGTGPSRRRSSLHRL